MTSQGRSEYRFSGVNIAKRALEVNKPSSYGSNENQGLIIPVLPRPDFPQEPSAVAFAGRQTQNPSTSTVPSCCVGPRNAHFYSKPMVDLRQSVSIRVRPHMRRIPFRRLPKALFAFGSIWFGIAARCYHAPFRPRTAQMSRPPHHHDTHSLTPPTHTP